MDTHGSDFHAGRRDRVRARIEAEGLSSLQPHEVIEFLLYYMVPRQDVNETAHHLVDAFGGVRGVLTAEVDALMARGLSRKCARWLRAVGDAARTLRQVGESEDVFIRDFRSAFACGCELYRNNPAPGTFQLCLDARGRVICRREITPSRSWGEVMVLRDAICDVLASRAHGVIIVQLLPRERAVPDDYDDAAARRYADTLYAAGCELLDVLLIGEDSTAGMRQLGRLPDRRQEITELGRGYLRQTPDPAMTGLGAYMRSLTEPENPEHSDEIVK